MEVVDDEVMSMLESASRPHGVAYMLYAKV
jgi:hypothetical protein